MHTRLSRSPPIGRSMKTRQFELDGKHHRAALMPRTQPVTCLSLALTKEDRTPLREARTKEVSNIIWVDLLWFSRTLPKSVGSTRLSGELKRLVCRSLPVVWPE